MCGRTCSTTRYATPGRSFSLRSNRTTPVSRQRLRLSNEWKDSEATCGLPQRSEPSSTSSSYLIQRAVSFHSHSSPLPTNSSNCTNTSWGLWSMRFFSPLTPLTPPTPLPFAEPANPVDWGTDSLRPDCAIGWILWRRMPRGSSDRWDVNSSMSASYKMCGQTSYFKLEFATVTQSISYLMD